MGCSGKGRGQHALVHERRRPGGRDDSERGSRDGAGSRVRRSGRLRPGRECPDDEQDMDNLHRSSEARHCTGLAEHQGCSPHACRTPRNGRHARTVYNAHRGHLRDIWQTRLRFASIGPRRRVPPRGRAGHTGNVPQGGRLSDSSTVSVGRRPNVPFWSAGDRVAADPRGNRQSRPSHDELAF